MGEKLLRLMKSEGLTSSRLAEILDRRFQYLPYHLRTQQTGIRSAAKNSAQFPADQP